MTMIPRFNRQNLVIRYVIALSLIALLSVTAYIMVHSLLGQGYSDAPTINLSGRQRMLSQKLTKEVLLFIGSETLEKKEHYRKMLAETAQNWSKIHLALQHGGPKLQLTGKNSFKIHFLFSKMAPYYKKIQIALEHIFAISHRDVAKIHRGSALVQDVIDASPLYLKWMDDIIFQYEREAQVRIDRFRHIETYIVILILLLLVLEALFIFRPMVNKAQKGYNSFQKTHKTLLSSKNYIDNIIKSMIDMLIVVDSDATIKMVNQATLNILQYDENELIGLPIGIIFAEEEEEEEEEDLFRGKGIQELIRQGFVQNLEKIYLTKNGQQIPVLFSGSVMHDDADQLQGIVCVAHDITERKEIQKELHLQSTALESAANAILITDALGKIIWFNKAFTTMTGYNKTILGENPSILKSGQHDYSLYKKLWTTILAGKVWHGTMVNKRKDGSFYDEEQTITPVINKKGEITNFVTIKQDVTKRKKTEKALNIAKDKAEESDRLKSAFLANMSHEIRTPMNSIIGFTELMLQDELPNKQKEYLQFIKNSSHVLLSVINDILDISKIEANQFKIERIPFELQPILNNITSIAKMLITQATKDITIKQSIPKNISTIILGDPIRIQQVMTNLVSNAVKFTEKGTIEYGVSLKNKSTLEFFVKDTGIGIPLKKQKEIFKPFRQADISTTRQHGGTGLGLTISKKIIKLMGGKIKLKSEFNTGHGSIFYFTHPYIALKTLDNKPEMITIDNHNDNLEEEKNNKILIVDDDLMNQKLAQIILENLGYSIDIASDGKEAVLKYKSDSTINLIFMDMQMPVLDGLEATKKIRELEKTEGKKNKIPIIALTAGAMLDEKQKCLDAGCNDYITKPINQKQLHTLLKKFLSA